MSVAENIPSRKRLTGTRVTGIHYGLKARRREVSAVSTYAPKAGDTTRTWYVIDAQDVVLGRLAVAAANLLRGKHKPTFTPNTDGGDFVIIVNAEKVALSGDKQHKKLAYRHSGYPGGLRSRTIGELLDKHPDRVVEKAIVGMIPKNKLGRQIKRKLHVYAGPQHPHAAQQPTPYEIKQVAQ
ncbi:MAG: large subunit ribosomal protein [Mycobacterium sp.]|jgi:large subunit ribosomal protein L13|nr:large subunit ribosomal protein [Mycobacterium sp.]